MYLSIFSYKNLFIPLPPLFFCENANFLHFGLALWSQSVYTLSRTKRNLIANCPAKPGRTSGGPLYGAIF